MSLGVATAFELAALGLFAGWLGAMIGIGGGVVIVPVLVLLFGFDIKLAVATSLVAVVATTLGGITGGFLGILVSPRLLSGLFAALMGLTAALMLRSGAAPVSRESRDTPASGDPRPGAGREQWVEPSGHEEAGKLAGSYYDPFQKKLVHYEATRLGLGAGVSLFAGIVSGMLGVGGGFIKVPAMNLGMRVPIKVAAATSNFMIGVTAISSLFVYLARGLVHPLIACPVALGVVGGALSGTRFAGRVSPRLLRAILAMVLILVGIQMFLRALGVSLG